eukprot:CAMPEP_0206245338 /NCGR_PEP_ID=MMETSP0047_2-20121206/18642_1 /ASSEMBLY_ACC=CAM_ASM_000192 /TAXON_ID=195065 /ORGANISM="Chroomonas mesostigmatica_cf, Strain CCMP1168" /LENGTH=84 /DNA_ID=CAMNT_0053670627 /DNA_START=46 /DNA_END=296 /DNA_ORIENTATION=-
MSLGAVTVLLCRACLGVGLLRGRGVAPGGGVELREVEHEVRARRELVGGQGQLAPEERLRDGPVEHRLGAVPPPRGRAASPEPP